MKYNEIPLLIASLAGPLLAGGLGSIATTSSIPTWYRTLNKPSWTPPSWLFGPVWTLLYVLMGVALFLVWRRGWNAPNVRPAIVLFAAQLIVNAGWSAVFFGLRSPSGGLAVLVVLWLLIAATTVAFYGQNITAGLLMLPYLAWVTFAGVLNATIWNLNR